MKSSCSPGADAESWWPRVDLNEMETYSQRSLLSEATSPLMSLVDRENDQTKSSEQ